jgi:FkbM family methyltransferase
VSAFDRLRRWRLQALMARQLTNWRETWDGYVGRRPPEALRFRDGLRLDPAGGSPAFLFLEIFANRCYRRVIAGGAAGVVVDLGANIGAFTVDWATRRPAVRVHAYEPDEETFAVLRKNVDANGLSNRVTFWNEAIAARDGRVPFGRGDASIVRGAFAAGADAQAVPAVSLATVVERAGGRVSLLKIDIEGLEADVLEGGAAVLGAVDEIVGECHPVLVPDVQRRLERVLAATHTTQFVPGTRCAGVFFARRRA